VVDAVGPGRRQLYEGREYDYVFDIDVQEGAPPLKLPYNASGESTLHDIGQETSLADNLRCTENPYSTAQRFLERHNLPMAYLDQVANFITTNSAGTTIGGGGDAYVDPYTGASRYRSNASSVPTAGPSGGADPYTGAGRYNPGGGGGGAPAPSAYQDPYTGASRYQGTPTPSAAPPAAAASNSLKILPVVCPASQSPVIPDLLTTWNHEQAMHIAFKQANVLRIRDKLSEYSDAVKEEISTSHLAIFSSEIRKFEEMFVVLGAAIDAGEPPAQDALGSEHLEVIVAALERWPMDLRWPGARAPSPLRLSDT
jgi:phospholipase A-2-activating protein